MDHEHQHEIQESNPECKVIFNCCWCHPDGSPESQALIDSLKPNEIISYGICDSCFKEQLAILDKKYGGIIE